MRSRPLLTSAFFRANIIKIHCIIISIILNFSHEKDNEMNQIPPQSPSLDPPLTVSEPNRNEEIEGCAAVSEVRKKYAKTT